jgi:hypothetical protein
MKDLNKKRTSLCSCCLLQQQESARYSSEATTSGCLPAAIHDVSSLVLNKRRRWKKKHRDAMHDVSIY